jgi:hypothetical protein
VNCWHCDRPAHALCLFCGRAVCRDHVNSLPHLLAVYQGAQDTPKGLVVPDAIHCGVCEPRDDPVSLDVLG